MPRFCFYVIHRCTIYSRLILVFNKNMSWNYRVLKHTNKHGEHFTIHEVYYEKGKPVMWSDDVTPYGETLDELKKDLSHIQEALSRPTLEVRGKGKKQTLH